MYQVLARKWRPKNFKTLVGQQHVTQALIYALDHQLIHHAYLFTGTRGVGKTTIARIFAKSLNCLKNGVSSEPCGECEHCREIDEGRFPDLIEVDAASRSQVEYTRQLLANVPYAPVKGRYKVYLIDEVHMFSDDSFNALLKTLEEPPEHVKFILATTDPQKMPATVLSRCLQFQLKNMTVSQIAGHLATVLNQEQITFEEEALLLLAEAANGSMRDSLSLLDQAVAYGQGKVLSHDVASLLGAVPAVKIRELLALLADGEASAIRIKLAEIAEFAPDYPDLLRRVLQGLQQITIAQLNAQRTPDEISQEMIRLAARLPIELVQLWYQIATDTWQVLPYQPDAGAALEMMLLRMLALQPILPETPLEKVSSIASALPMEEQVTTLDELVEQFTHTTEQEQSLLSNPDVSISEQSSAQQVIELREQDNEKIEYSPPRIEEDSVTNDNLSPQATEHSLEVPLEEMRNEPLLPVQLYEAIGHPERWAAFIEQLNLGQFAQVLGENFCLSDIQGKQLLLSADQAGQIWQSPQWFIQMAEAISEHISVSITLKLSDKENQITHFAQKQQAIEEEKVRAKQAFQSHPAVNHLINELSATIEPDSIYSLKEKES
ncbi:DNA polymerase III subunit gamma/tau [Suttonella ornithocola]|uniref:DNA polymerase III subunit gamma/tau n=1 Tax=Suttonella ornithocola TaxID=279832 RepID=A0A380N0T6_9GAMM|nr:DNA polymerase III subunit gamma/tau [Suttonella ornithocola]SUO97733.1 DNA polymerase III subunit tau [Suttonella ornithocola]